MKFGQILVCCMTNVCNMFLAQWWKLKTSPRRFYFIKMTLQQDVAVFNSWHLPFLIISCLPFQKIKPHILGIIGYWVIGAGW